MQLCYGSTDKLRKIKILKKLYLTDLYSNTQIYGIANAHSKYLTSGIHIINHKNFR
jgi:hypothetical protein